MAGILDNDLKTVVLKMLKELQKDEEKGKKLMYKQKKKK